MTEPKELHVRSGLDSEALWQRYADAMEAHYRDDVQPKAGAEAFLEQLRNENVRTWIVTASRKDQCEAAVTRCALRAYFERVISLRGSDMRKKDPTFFTWLASEVDVGVSELLVVEDSEAIARTAKAAGCVVWGIWEPWNGEEGVLRAVCDAVAVDFAGLPGVGCTA